MKSRPSREAAKTARMKWRAGQETQSELKRMFQYDDDDDTEAVVIRPDLTISCVGCNHIIANGSRMCTRTGRFFYMDKNYCKQHYDIVAGKSNSVQTSSTSSDPNLILFVTAETTCSICFCIIDEHDLTLTNCGHMFHHSCLVNWKVRNSACPCCRRTTHPFRGNSSRMKVVKEIKPRSFC